MERSLAAIARLDTVAEVLELSRDYAARRGVIRQSYHFTPIFDAPTSPRTIIQSEGFSEEWLELYARSDFRSSDPIPARTLQHGAMLPWREAMVLDSNTPENERYFAAMAEHGLVHGFGVPLFGPHGRDAYASFDFGSPVEQVDEEALASVCSLAQIGHLRICMLIEEERDKPMLSQRESEVLHWMARGKSNTDIATILEISPETVRTYVQRVYSKLGSHERVAAIVRALKLGLVDY